MGTALTIGIIIYVAISMRSVFNSRPISERLTNGELEELERMKEPEMDSFK